MMSRASTLDVGSLNTYANYTKLHSRNRRNTRNETKIVASPGANISRVIIPNPCQMSREEKQEAAGSPFHFALFAVFV